jgi:hypothetical protein
VEANANVPDENALILPIKRLVETARSTSILAPGVEMEFASFIRCHLRALGGESVPPEFDANTIDVMGWLELPAEDAPCVAVTSLIDGHVPARVVTEDAFLPGRMRRDLGIHDDASRMARDIYVLTSAAAWRKGGLRVLVPRRDSRGEATRPSRILLAGLTGRELAVRWMRLVEPNADRFALPAQSTLEPLRGPQVLLPSQIAEMLPYQRPESLRVSSFRDYLANPRLFFFKHVLKLRSHRDDVRELGPGAVGSLVHELLAAFGRDPLVGDLIDAEAIYAVLIRELDALWKVRFGDLTTAAVQFQKESVAMSLRMFADAQAEQRQLGWRIVWCEGGESDEVSPTATLTKAPDGTVLTVRGRCDRIDFRDSAEPGHARWRVIDYKTSQKPADLRKAHRGPGAEAPWKDLQMPLYHLLFPSFVADFGLVGWSDTDVVDLCYFSIPEDHAACGVSEPCPVEWIDGSEGEKSALAEAKRIALRVWDGQFDEPGRLSDYDDPELRALCGCFNLSDDSESSEEDDE